MTNDEKAREICHCSECTYKIKSEGDNCMCPRMAAILQAMNWKDEQYNEEKRDLLGLVKMLKIDEHNQTIIEDLVAILNS